LLGIFGGSFDPPHLGHLHIIQNFINEYHTKVYIVPNSLSPFKQKKGVSSENILEMLYLLKKEFSLEDAEIYDTEIKRGGISYTYQTLQEFHSKYPKEEIFLLIGEDNLESLHKWKEVETIFSLAKVLVYLRPSLNRSKIPMELEKFQDRILIKNNALNPASSTLFRESGEDEMISTLVKEYIYKNKLYGND
jgi:nicotinate-nucleotide adenylyltransferase